MKTVSIFLNDREIEKFQLTKPTLFIGRSPTCDVILRAKSVRPMHFVMEWVGEGQFDAEKGFWSIIDISTSSRKENSSGEGLILGSENAKFGNFEFRFTKDDLAESYLKKGVLKRTVDQNMQDLEGTPIQSVEGVPSDQSCLEVVSFRNDLEAVESVNHYEFNSSIALSTSLKTLPRIQFAWSEKNMGFLDSRSESAAFEIFNRNELVASNSDSKERIEMTEKDILIVRSPQYDYYLRLVPKVNIKYSKERQFDRTLLSLLTIIIVMLLISFIIPKLPDFKVEAEKLDEARIARVELYEPPPEPEPIVEKPPEKIEQASVPLVEVKPDKKTPDKMAAPTVKTVEEKTKDMTPGLNIKAPVKKENQMGILGAIKANKSAGSRSKVKADQILGNRPPSEVDTDSGTALVARSKAGALGVKDKAGGNEGTGPQQLESASTTLKSSFVKSKDGSGIIAKSDGSALERGLPSSTGKSLKSGAAVGFDDGATTEVTGGLDKDAVRQAIRENQVQIRACYERALSESSRRDFSGKMSFHWKISPQGDVSETKLTYSDFKIPTFENCVKRIIDRIIFPNAANKQTTFVKYPFIFQGKK